MEAKTPPDEVFATIRLDTGDPCACTPELAEGERGIRLAAPSRVPVAKDVVVPLCAIARYEADEWSFFPSNFWHQLLLVVLNVDTNVLRTRTLGDPSPIPTPEKPPKPSGPPGSDSEPSSARGGEGSPAESAADSAPVPLLGGLMTVYRNFDLSGIVPIGPAPGRYYAFLTYGPHRSNVVRIELFDPAKPELERR